MAGTEIAFTIPEWQVWVPILIAAFSLIFSFRQMRRTSNRDTLKDMESRIDRAMKALTECESNLKQCGHEKDELRREKFALLEQIASMAKPAPPSDEG